MPPMALLRSGTVRLVVGMFALQVILAGLVLGYVYVAAARQLAEDERAYATGLIDDIAAAAASGGRSEAKALIDARLGGRGGEALVLLLASADGGAVAGNLPGWPAGLVPARGWQPLTIWRGDGSRPTLWVAMRRLPDGAQLLAGRDADERRPLADVIGRAALTSLLLAVPLALLLALLLGRSADARLRAISQTVTGVTGLDLSRRALRDGSRDAFDELAAALNRMLDRIEALVAELRILTDGLAHDLRSPLTRLRSALEDVQAVSSDPHALTALAAATDAADRLLAMLTTSLQISRAEAGIGREHFASTDIDALLDDITEVFGPLAEEQGVALIHAGDPVGRAVVHRQLLQQALGNLIENALHHASGLTRIEVGARRQADRLVLRVADNGCGIPPDQRDRARQRFVRLDVARHVGGSGLGLALVESVCRLHDGILELDDNRPGLDALMFIPAGD